MGPTAGLEGGGEARSYRDSILVPSNPQQVSNHAKLFLHNVRTPVYVVTIGTLATLIISVTVVTVRTLISTHLTIKITTTTKIVFRLCLPFLRILTQTGIHGQILVKSRNIEFYEAALQISIGQNFRLRETLQFYEITSLRSLQPFALIMATTHTVRKTAQIRDGRKMREKV